MNAETINTAIGCIDDDLIEAADALRGRRKTNTQWKRWTALAACLCLVFGTAIVFFQGFPILGAKCGGSPGVLVDGRYYYATDFGFYRYALETRNREFLMSTFFVSSMSGWKVDEHGLYYVRGRTLYVREHETGNSRRLYTADTSIWIRYLENGQITIWLYDRSRVFDEFHPYVCIDVKTGEVIWERMMTDDEVYALLDSGNVNREYAIGNHIFRVVEESSADGYLRELHLDGQPFITPEENEFIEFWLEFFGGNLLIQHRVYSGEPGGSYNEALSEYMYLLVSPDGEIRELPSEWYITGTDEYLFFLVDDAPSVATGSFPVNLYGLNILTGETTLLLTDADIYTAVTDGTWFITNVPWSGRTDCWKLVYDDLGKLIGLELWVGDI